VKVHSNPESALVIAVHYEPSGVDPHINAAELGLQMTMGVFDTLVYKTGDGRFWPYLAERWEISADELTYRFMLRQDVSFHDGTHFDAAAMKFSLDRARDPQNKSQLAGSMLGPYIGSSVVDEYTLEVRLGEPYGQLLDMLSQGWLAPVSPSAVRLLGNDFRRHPVGTGPFIFDSWAPGKGIRLRRNPGYCWPPHVVANRGTAHVADVSFVFMEKGSDRTTALESGQVNGVFYVAPEDAAGLRADQRFTVRTWPIGGVPVCLMLNTSRAPTDDILVRQALACAIDQDAIVQEVFRGEFPPARGPIAQSTLGYAEAVEAYHLKSLERANELLDAAGWAHRNAAGVRQRDGALLQLVFWALPVNYYPDFGRLVCNQLGDVGIAVDVQIKTPGEWISGADAGRHHMVPQGKYTSGPQILSYIHHSRASRGSYGWTKRSADYPAELDGLLEQGEQARDPQDYLRVYARAQESIMREALIVPLHCNTNIVALARGITGLSFDAIGAYPLLHDVRVEGVEE